MRAIRIYSIPTLCPMVTPGEPAYRRKIPPALPLSKEPRPCAGVSHMASTSPRETQAHAAKLHRRTVKRHKCEEDAIALLILCKGVSWPGTQMSDLYMDQRCE